MTDARTESIAFREARLKSERLRIWIVLVAIRMAFLLRATRASTVGGHENLVSLYMTVGLLTPFVGFELAMLRKINRTTLARRDFSHLTAVVIKRT